MIRPDERISFDEYFSHPFLDLEHYPLEESYAKAVSLARKAVQLDYEKNYLEAFNVYGSALSYLVPFLQSKSLPHLAYIEHSQYIRCIIPSLLFHPLVIISFSAPLSPEREEFIRKKVMEYFRRAEQLKSVLYKSKEAVGNELATVSDVLSKSRRPQTSEKRRSAAVAEDSSLASESSTINQLHRAFNQLSLVQQDQSLSDTRVNETPSGNAPEATFAEIDLKALSRLPSLSILYNAYICLSQSV